MLDAAASVKESKWKKVQTNTIKLGGPHLISHQPKVILSLNQNYLHSILSRFSSKARFPLEQHSSSPFAFGHATLRCSSWYNLTDLNGFMDWKKGLKRLFMASACIHSLKKQKGLTLLQLGKLRIYLHEPIDNPSLVITTSFLISFLKKVMIAAKNCIKWPHTGALLNLFWICVEVRISFSFLYWLRLKTKPTLDPKHVGSLWAWVAWRKKFFSLYIDCKASRASSCCNTM